MPEKERIHTNGTVAAHSALGLLLSAAADELFPEREFYIEHSFIGGFYCHFGQNSPATRDELNQLSQRIKIYLQDERPIEIIEVDRSLLEERFQLRERGDKLEILGRIRQDPVPASRCRQYLDYRLEPMSTDPEALQDFNLALYDTGFVLRSPAVDADLPEYDSPKLYQIIQQREEWGRALHVNNLYQLNARLVENHDLQLPLLAEALHEKTIAEIADSLAGDFPQRRTVFIAGPSSSGKTTFSKRLAIQVKVIMLDTLTVSMDDYFKDRDEMTPSTDGSLDFESLDAMDVELLTADIRRLLAGETIQRRKYSFRKGRGYYNDETRQLDENAFLAVEGIHGLNPVFPEQLGAETVQRIYVSAITQLNIDNEHRVFSSDNRLIRRLVRDAQFRGYSAEETLSRWPSVRQGEERYIFTHQEQADLMFNSSLIYELCALRPKAEAILQAVPAHSPARAEADRLLMFLGFITPIDEGAVPRTSILREFLGNGAFEY
ncbi:MAG: nucleoside kinase [Candidatus Marinimicrobia bacterium]|nr:nucleoside kinase [Candidatus Neomarinimicrobiota bacterium]